MQFNLRQLGAFVASCAVVVAACSYRDFLAIAVIAGLLAGWSTQIRHIPLRWTLVACLGGASVSCLGLLCVDVALQRSDLARDPLAETLALLGPFFAVVGLALATMGVLMAIVRHTTGTLK